MTNQPSSETGPPEQDVWAKDLTEREYTIGLWLWIFLLTCWHLSCGALMLAAMVRGGPNTGILVPDLVDRVAIIAVVSSLISGVILAPLLFVRSRLAYAAAGLHLLCTVALVVAILVMWSFCMPPE